MEGKYVGIVYEGQPLSELRRITHEYFNARLALLVTDRVRILSTKQDRKNKKPLSWELSQLTEALDYYRGLTRKYFPGQKTMLIFCKSGSKAHLPEGIDTATLPELQKEKQEYTGLESEVDEGKNLKRAVLAALTKSNEKPPSKQDAIKRFYELFIQ